MRAVDFAVLSFGVLLNAFAQLGLKAATRVTGPLIVPGGGTWNRALELLSSSLMPLPQLFWPIADQGLVASFTVQLDG